MVENLGLAGSSVGDKGLIEDIENVLADLLKLRLDLVAVVADGRDVLVGALRLLLLLDRGDNAPAGAAGANDILVGDREEVALVDGKLATKLGNLLHVANHFIIALGLLAKAGEESLAVVYSVSGQLHANRRERRGHRPLLLALGENWYTHLSRYM